jgi:hypothetical protein
MILKKMVVVLPQKAKENGMKRILGAILRTLRMLLMKLKSILIS